MRKTSVKLSPAQFAKLHEVNKRTLYYYDSIGLFQPNTKNENGYRYYDISQSLDFEYIRMLKELNMSIEEIENYRKKPTPEKFLAIAKEKEKELEREIQKRKRTKKILQEKKRQIQFCENLKEREICVETYKAERILTMSFDFEEDDVAEIFAKAKTVWSIDQIRRGIGGYISVEKVYQKDFSRYDGIYTIALENRPSAGSMVKPEGTYLCGYQKGTWDKLPELYEEMLEYADAHQFRLVGNAYEVGWNDFVISDPKEYITKVMIQIEEI